MKYEYFISRRYLKSRKRTKLISFPTLFSFIVILLSVSSITIFLSIMNGFESIVVDRFLLLDSHIHLTGKGIDKLPDPDNLINKVKEIKDISGYSPYVQEKAMLISTNGTMVVTLKGIDLETVDDVSHFRSRIVFGSDDFTSFDSVQTSPGIILGDGVADHLGVLLGDKIRVMSFVRFLDFRYRLDIKYSYFIRLLLVLPY